MNNNFVITLLLHSAVSEIPELFKNRDIFKYLNCGSYFGKNQNFNNLINDNGFGDNQWYDNISNLNKYVNDHTGVYFLGKHIDKLFPNIEYIGNMQYSKGFFFNQANANKNTIFLPMLIDGRTNIQKFSNYFLWEKLWKIYKDILFEKHSKYADIEKYENETISAHFNMFFTMTNIFKKWFELYVDGINVCKKMIEENCHDSFKDTKTMNFNQTQLYDSFRIYAYMQEFFAGYCWWKLTNQYMDTNYKIYNCRFFGFDKIKAKTRESK